MPLVCHPDRNEVSATERNVVERYFFVRIFFTALTALTTLVGGTTFALAQTTPAPSTLPTLGVHDYLNPLPATPSAPTWDTPTPSPASNFALPAAPAPYAATTQAGAPVVPQSVSQSIATPEAPSTNPAHTTTTTDPNTPGGGGIPKNLPPSVTPGQAADAIPTFYNHVPGGAGHGISIAVGKQGCPRGVIGCTLYETNTTAVGGARSLILSLLAGVLKFAAVIAVLMLVVAGSRFVTSRGSADGTKAATKQIIYTVMGLFVIMASLIIVQNITTMAYKTTDGSNATNPTTTTTPAAAPGVTTGTGTATTAPSSTDSASTLSASDTTSVQTPFVGSAAPAPSTSDSAAAPITESKHNINVVSLPDDTAAVPKAPDGATCDAAATYAQSHPTAADCQDQLNYFRSTCVPAGYTNIFFECGARTAPAPAAPAVTWTSQPDQSPTDQCDAAAAYVKNNPSGTDCPAQMNYYTTVCMAQLHLSGFFGSCHGRSR